MSETGFNLLTEPLLNAQPHGFLSLPGVLAQLSRDTVDSFPALRPHQEPAWHMFLVQLAALALHHAGVQQLPTDEDAWRRVLRGLTPGFDCDEPWRLVVEDTSQPAFMQPPIPHGVKEEDEVPTPDALDLLITAKNHDLKMSVASDSEAQDWVFALVSLQTSEGFGGAKNYGIARMNGGSSSRVLLALAPMSNATSREIATRTGLWFKRDVSVLLARRNEEYSRNEHLGYKPQGGVGLIWIEPWPEKHQFRTSDLDLWFIEVCRRIRMRTKQGLMIALKGTSAKARIAADGLKGAVGDPWAPVHKVENKSFTLGEGDFTYKKLEELLFSGEWRLPVLAKPQAAVPDGETMLLVAQALARGNCKSWGFRSRSLPIGGKVCMGFGTDAVMDSIHEVALEMMNEIATFDKTMRDALAIMGAGGNLKKNGKSRFECTQEARSIFDREVDAFFFPHLWSRYEAKNRGDEAVEAARLDFLRQLNQSAVAIFEQALLALPCGSLYRPRAEARARSCFYGRIHVNFPAIFENTVKKEDTDVAE